MINLWFRCWILCLSAVSHPLLECSGGCFKLQWWLNDQEYSNIQIIYFDSSILIFPCILSSYSNGGGGVQCREMKQGCTMIWTHWRMVYAHQFWPFTHQANIWFQKTWNTAHNYPALDLSTFWILLWCFRIPLICFQCCMGLEQHERNKLTLFFLHYTYFSLSDL